MRYMFLYYSAPDAGPAEGSPGAAAEMQEWFAFAQAMADAAVAVDGAPLYPAADRRRRWRSRTAGR